MADERLRAIMGANIRKKRRERELTIEELSAIVGVSSGFLGLIERGERGMSPDNLLKMISALEMTLDDVYDTTGLHNSSFAEETVSNRKAKRDKIQTLISNLTEKELDFTIQMIKNIKSMNHSR